jgi:integration host factor subunit beta
MTKKTLTVQCCTRFRKEIPDLERSSLRETGVILDIVFEEITKGLQLDQRFEYPEWGRLIVRRRKARSGRNPRTGEALTIAEKNLPLYKAAPHVLELLNNGTHDTSRTRRQRSARPAQTRATTTATPQATARTLRRTATTGTAQGQRRASA